MSTTTAHRVAVLLVLLPFVLIFVAFTDAFSISLQPLQSSSSSSSSTKVPRYGYHHINTNRFPSIVSSALLASTSLSTSTSTSTSTICDKNKDESTLTSSSSSSSLSSYCLDKGLLLSSFNDGLKSNPYAINWLMNALVETLFKEEQQHTQLALKKSNIFSPCNGPDPVILEQLENIDRVVVGQQGMCQNDINNDEDDDDDDDNNNISIFWRKNLELLCQMKTPKQPIDLRILYIPTAMYALRSGSTSTLGKQRGRNRADGKKRRTDIIRLLADQLDNNDDNNNNNNNRNDDDGNEENERKGIKQQQQQQVYNIRTITLDFDDGSVKQPELVTIGDTSNSDDDGGVLEFPKSGKEAIREWKPHLIYVQGGNTFWLHHCMEKGDWTQDLIDACCCNSNNDVNSSPPSTSTSSAVYCGVSAGAILAGRSMQTACWKEWDDPSVVPGRETYEDWTYIKGLDVTGGDTFFPHMEDQWQDMVKRQTKNLVESGISTQTSSVRCIRDDDSYVVDGRQQYTTKLPSPIRNE